MEFELLNLFLSLLTILITISFVTLLFILLIKFLKAGNIIIEEHIETNSDINDIKYFITLKNIKKKQTIVKDFGILVDLYKIPLLKKKLPNIEQYGLEIIPRDTIKVELSDLVNSKIIEYINKKVYFYYEDSLSRKYTFKSKLLKKYFRILKKDNHISWLSFIISIYFLTILNTLPPVRSTNLAANGSISSA